MMLVKKRLDEWLVENNIFENRNRARAAILAGKILVNDNSAAKAGTMIGPKDNVVLKENDYPFVSRGGLKLEKALREFNIDVKSRIAIDVGSSTGGFTDCLLQNGAKKVIAVDVGYGQMAWKLRNDPRVLLLERKNVRYLTSSEIPEKVDVIVVDVSFISVKKFINNLRQFLKPDGIIIFLAKPQFEAGKEKVEKKGVIKTLKIHLEVLEDLWKYFEENEFYVNGLTYSPIAGIEGNIEFLFYLTLVKKKDFDKTSIIENVVREAHIRLG
ncbi:MAG: TlyA family RNA methyltransferase [Actinobacteria bacterium]|nr:TlyA family RNA methyltransferase [Actinomycetota bacterium]